MNLYANVQGYIRIEHKKKKKETRSMTGKLYLADGSLYQGHGFGAKKTAVGELVFNTSMTGYQEILTDPSYWGGR